MRHGIPEFRPRQPLDRQLTAATLNDIRKELESLRITRVVNGTVRKLPGGTEITVPPQRGGAQPVAKQPWDITATLNPDNESQYILRVQAGTLSGVLPTNWDDEFTVAATGLHYAKAVVATDGREITSVTIEIDTTAPVSQTPTLFAVESNIDVLFGMFIEGQAVRTIAAGNIERTPRVWFSEPRQDSLPGESQFNDYFVLAP